MYIFRFDEKTNMFMVVGGLNHTISKLAKHGNTEAIIENTHVKILTSKRERLFVVDSDSGHYEFLESDGDARDQTVDIHHAVYGTRTEYTLHVYNMSTIRSEVLCDFLFSDYLSPDSIVVPFTKTASSLKLRRSSKKLSMYDSDTGNSIWQREFDDDIIHVLRPVGTRRRTLHK